MFNIKSKLTLKPCPFCGGEASLWVEFVPYENQYERDERNLYHRGCPRCQVYFSRYWDEVGVIFDWNTRAVCTDEATDA